MDTGYINRNRNNCFSLREPFLNGLADGYKNIRVQLADEAVSFKQGNEFSGTGKAVSLALPAK